MGGQLLSRPDHSTGYLVSSVQPWKGDGGGATVICLSAVDCGRWCCAARDCGAEPAVERNARFRAVYCGLVPHHLVGLAT